jgi:phosphate-transporting ATPase
MAAAGLQTLALSRLHLAGIDLSVEPGTCVSVTGKSGAGKSVLLRMIADLDPHGGDVMLDGERCSSMPAPAWRRRVTYVAAESGWWARQVRDHFSPATDLAALLPAFGMAAEAADWPIDRLSTGERQRLALLRALTPDNRVLLRDEPTSALDGASVALVETLLRQRLAQGTAIVLTTHDPAQARRLASRHLVLQDGRLGDRP